MYVKRIDVSVPTTRAVELQRQNDRRTEVLQQQRGFASSLLLNSLGYPVMNVSPMYYPTTGYTLLTEWDDAKAADELRRSPEWDAFASANPSEGLFESQHKATDYEVVRRVSGKIKAVFAWGIEIQESAVATESDLTELLGLYFNHLRGLAEGSVLRSDDGRSLFMVLLLSTQTEFWPGRTIPEIQKFYRSHFPIDGSSFATPTGFQVIRQSRPI